MREQYFKYKYKGNFFKKKGNKYGSYNGVCLKSSAYKGYFKNIYLISKSFFKIKYFYTFFK